MRLATHDFDTVHAAILELNSHRDLKHFRAALSGIMLRLIPADYFVWNELLINPGNQTLHVVDFVESTPGQFRPFAERIGQIIYEHPFTRPFTENPNPTALMFSDFYTIRQLLKTHLYQVGYAPLGYRRQMSVPVLLHAGLISSLNFSGRSRNFRERNRQALNLIRTHFKQAFQNAELATARTMALSQPLVTYHLTPREAELALRLAEGKTNPEIAAILGLSVRTVEKHMEKILEKLGAENRTTAAVIVPKAGGNSS